MTGNTLKGSVLEHHYGAGDEFPICGLVESVLWMKGELPILTSSEIFLLLSKFVDTLFKSKGRGILSWALRWHSS